MVVSNIIKDKKKSYYLLTIDGKDYKMNEEVIIKYRLVPGKEITKDDLELYLKNNDKEDGYMKAYNYISKYPQSKGGLIKYLKNKEYSEEDITYIVSKLEEFKVIDDYKYALSIIGYYIRSGYGYNMLKSKLIGKLIPSDIISIVLEEINYDEYNAALLKLIEKNSKKYQQKPNGKMLLIKYLYSRGYLMDEINQALVKM